MDASGITPTVVGALPEQCAALNRTNINVQLLALQAARTLRREDIYRAVMMDPHTQSELSIDDIVAMCDDLIAAHGIGCRNTSKQSFQKHSHFMIYNPLAHFSASCQSFLEAMLVHKLILSIQFV